MCEPLIMTLKIPEPDKQQPSISVALEINSEGEMMRRRRRFPK